VDQNTLSKLGGYLLAHRAEIIGEWLRAVEKNPEIKSSEVLRYKELVDHLPKLFENLAELLKSGHSNPKRSEVCRDARVHGKHRWRQGYRLEEVIREASIVRHILFDRWLDLFAREEPEFDGKSREVAENIIRQAVHDIFTESVDQFEEEQQKKPRSQPQVTRGIGR
jgi:RsbT co-antagonist protein rsbRD N-terminal domain